MPLIETLLRMASRGGKVEDNFNRSLTGSLGSTSLGAMPWSVITGTWNVSGTRPTTSTSHSSNPLAVLNPNTPNIDATLEVGAGDALYFRVQDADDWWRILWEGYQTSSCQTCCSTCCSSTCCSTCTYTEYCCCEGQGLNCNQCQCGSCATCTYPAGDPETCYSSGSCTASCNCYSCNCYSCNCSSCNCTYYDNYRAKLQRMVAGTLTDIATGSVVSTATTKLRIVTQQDQLTAYWGSSAQTQLYSGAQTTHAAQTKHGIGRGASSYNSSAIDNLVMNFH